MPRSIEEILKDGQFQWSHVLTNARRYMAGSWLILTVITAVWYALPHPLLLSLPDPGQPAAGGAMVVWLVGSGALWFLASAGIRLSYARFASGRPDLPAGDEVSDGEVSGDAQMRNNASRLILRYAGVLLYVALVMAAASAIILVLLGLMILPASRVDGARLFSGYVAPIALGLILVLLRVRYAVSIETVLQHGDAVREGVRRGLALFRERRLVVTAMTTLVYLFWIPELVVSGLAADQQALIEVSRVVSAVVRNLALVLWLSWYHEARRTASEDA